MKWLEGNALEQAEIGFEEHRNNSEMEYKLYTKVRQRQLSIPNNSRLHFIFDFAEKVLLPKMERQPGNLHFVAG